MYLILRSYLDFFTGNQYKILIKKIIFFAVLYSIMRMLNNFLSHRGCFHSVRVRVFNVHYLCFLQNRQSLSVHVSLLCFPCRKPTILQCPTHCLSLFLPTTITPSPTSLYMPLLSFFPPSCFSDMKLERGK